jgi:uncharacterized membrane protein YeiH
LALTAFLIVDLIAIATNSINGALLARSPTHYKDYTDAGILILAVIGGLAGGVTRDILLNEVPVALTNPIYVPVALAAGGIAILLTYRTAEEFLTGAFQFFTAFAIPWYAVVGADKGLRSNVGILGASILGIVDATTGQTLVDVASGVTAHTLVRGEWYVGTAVLASAIYVGLAEAGLSFVPATFVTVAVGFGLRYAALGFGWELPEPQEPIPPHRQRRPPRGR